MGCPGDMVFIDPDGVQRKKSGLGPQLVNVKKKKKRRERSWEWLQLPITYVVSGVK